MTLREPIQDILVDHFGVSYAGSKITADAILAAIREHMTSEDVIQDIGSSLELVGFVHFPDAGADHLRAAILAALGGEP